MDEAIRLIYKINSKLRGHKNKKREDFSSLAYQVPPIGFEPMTYGLENRCSIQLSYGGIINLKALKPNFLINAAKIINSKG